MVYFLIQRLSVVFRIVSPELRCSGRNTVTTTTTLHVHHNFRAFLSLRARVYHVKFPNRTICDEKSVHLKTSRDRHDKETERFT